MTRDRMFRFGDGEKLKCSFCGKSQEQVRKLVAGPGVYICDECIELCTEIIEEELYGESEAPAAPRHTPKPREIYDTLCQYVIGQDRGIVDLAGLGGVARRDLRYPVPVRHRAGPGYRRS